MQWTKEKYNRVAYFLPVQRSHVEIGNILFLQALQSMTENGYRWEPCLKNWGSGLPLTAERKLLNRELSKERIVIENINAKIKTFKIMSEKYRNRHLLRMNLICAILNYELN